MSPTRAASSLLISALVVVLICGCGGGGADDFELDPLRLVENLETRPTNHHPTKYGEVDLGEYFITLAVKEDIEIYMLTLNITVIAPHDKTDEIAEKAAKQGSRLRDQVIATIQHIDEENLQDPELVWLKAELISLLRRLLRTHEIRDVVFPKLTLEKS